MDTVLDNAAVGKVTSAKAIFDKFAEQMEASAVSFNRMRGGQDMHCERTPNRISVFVERYPRLAVEVEFDEAAGTIRMRRQKLEHPSEGRMGTVVSDLRFTVDLKKQVYLEPGDYRRLAHQALLPLMDVFE